MKLSGDDLARQKASFWTRTELFCRQGYDRIGAASFIVDQAGPLEGPALDVGTGMGLTARALAGRGLEVVTVDTSAEDQQVAEGLSEDPDISRRIRFILADAARLPFATGHFGCAVVVDVLHHLDAGAAVLAEIARVLKPGATLVVADFSREGFEMVSRVYAAEGRVHPEGPVTTDWARGFLSGLGATEQNVVDGHLHHVGTFTMPVLPRVPPAFATLDRAGLLTALDVFANNWLAHDGCWFIAAEERFGLDVAMDLDAAAWRRFAAAEARRILDAFSIPRRGGLAALRQALAYRMYSFINPSSVEWSADGAVLRFFMEACRVQQTRHHKGLPDFPCKRVGEVEFATFASTVDARIHTTCLYCPPDPDARGRCGWEFRMGVDDREPA